MAAAVSAKKTHADNRTGPWAPCPESVRNSCSTAAAAASQTNANHAPPAQVAASTMAAKTSADTMRCVKVAQQARRLVMRLLPPCQCRQTAVAAVIFGQRARQFGGVEVRPIAGRKHQFGIGRLPKQEIRQAHARRWCGSPDRDRECRRVEALREGLMRHADAARALPATASSAAIWRAARTISSRRRS